MVVNKVYQRSGKCKCLKEILYSMGLIKTSILDYDILNSKRARCPICSGMYSTVVLPELLGNG